MRKQTYQELLAMRLKENEAIMPENRFPLILILDNIRSMYNVGSIFRTADGIRAQAVYTSGYTPHPPRAEITKTALGATRTVPHKHFSTVIEAIREVKITGAKIAALELTQNAKSVFELQKKDLPLGLIIGNEINGVSSEALELSDFAISIPMLGSKHSLNVAVASGIAIYECLRNFKDELERFRPTLPLPLDSE
jgi:23S rRNA (guanosine2251-2'-O)-methyltransferase